MLKVLAPASFAAGAPVVPIVLAGYGASMLAAYYEALFWCINRPGLSTVAVGVTFVVNLALNFALIPPFGYIGAAVATGVAFVAQLGFCIVLASRLRLIRTRLRTPVMLAVAALIMAASMLLVRDLVGDQGVAALVVIAGGGRGGLRSYGDGTWRRSAATGRDLRFARSFNRVARRKGARGVPPVRNRSMAPAHTQLAGPGDGCSAHRAPDAGGEEFTMIDRAQVGREAWDALADASPEAWLWHRYDVCEARGAGATRVTPRSLCQMVGGWSPSSLCG